MCAESAGLGRTQTLVSIRLWGRISCDAKSLFVRVTVVRNDGDAVRHDPDSGHCAFDPNGLKRSQKTFAVFASLLTATPNCSTALSW
ncbi:MAG: hypothetical protein ACI9DC_001301 [Gammaproteobacteria bacterium]|jgi:hypothetical protein